MKKMILFLMLAILLATALAGCSKTIEPEDKGIIGIWTAYEKETVEIGEGNEPVISTPKFYYNFRENETGYRQYFSLEDDEIKEGSSRFYFNYTHSGDALNIYDYSGYNQRNIIQLDGDQMVMQTTLCTGDGDWNIKYSLHKGMPTIDDCEDNE